MTLRLRYAAKSDVGLLREGNEDSAYAGPRLLAVADGMGGHAHGEVASAGVIAALAPLDESTSNDLTGDLAEAVQRANEDLRRMVEADPTLEGMGTTLTAILWAGERSALAHIGDSRAYLLRGGELHRITRDHTLVQSLIDEGRIGEEEAAVHPQRSLLLRALDGRTEVDPDLSAHDSGVGDRYLICSDGLSGVVSEDTLRETLNAGWDPDRVVQQLIELANRGGGPDNITCVVADVVEAPEETALSPLVVGAAAHSIQGGESTEDTLSMDTSAGRAAALMHPPADPEEEYDESAGYRPRRKWPRLFLSLLIIVVVLGGASYSILHYLRSQFYVGSKQGEVVIFRGITPEVAGRSLSRVYTRTGLSVTELPNIQRSAVADSIQADSLNGAREIVHRLRGAAAARTCAEQRQRERSRQSSPPRTDQPRTEEPRRRDRQEDQQREQRQRSTQQQAAAGAHSAPSPELAPAPSPSASADPCPEGVSAADG